MIIRIFVFLIGILLLTTSSAQISGSGSTLSRLLYEEMLRHYELLTEIKVNYKAIGSGKGVQELLGQNTDFAATDMPLTDIQQTQATINGLSEIPNTILHIPIAITAVTLAYNFAPFQEIPELTLNGDVLAKIFLGEVRFWNDEAIAALNPSMQLPNLPIFVVHRNDPSGTTSIFTDYLSKVSNHWIQKMGSGPLEVVKWPVGFSENSNINVAEMIRQTPGAIGYIAFSEAKQAKLKIAKLQNAAGKVVSPTTEALTVAAEIEIPNDMRVSITNTTHEQGWPIAGFTWLLLYQDQNYAERSLHQAEQVKSLVNWMLTDGQNLNKNLGYAPVTKEIQDKAILLLDNIYYTTFE